MKPTNPVLFACWLALAVLAACDRDGRPERERSGEQEVEINEDLGALKVMNGVDEPVTVYVNGQEIYSVPPGEAYTFRNLPTGRTTIYGVGRVSQRHYALPEVEIEEGGEYEWTIRP